jgi:hypothetical protein
MSGTPGDKTYAKRQMQPFETPAVTPGFKGKTECIDHVCARIKLHTRLDIMNTKNQCHTNKELLPTIVLNES